MIDKQKESRLRDMLSYISSEWTTGVRQRSPGVFYVPGSFVHVDSDVFNDPARESAQITIDFNQRKATWWAAYVSGHNGDTFGDETGDIPWENVLDSYEKVRSRAKEKAKRDIVKEEEARAKLTLDAVAEKRLKEMFND